MSNSVIGVEENHVHEASVHKNKFPFITDNDKFVINAV